MGAMPALVVTPVVEANVVEMEVVVVEAEVVLEGDVGGAVVVQVVLFAECPLLEVPLTSPQFHINTDGEPPSPPLDMDLVQNDFRIDEGIKKKKGQH